MAPTSMCPGCSESFPASFPRARSNIFISISNAEWPSIETKDAWITVGIDRDLNKALEILTSETTQFLIEQRKLGKDEARKAMMASWDCRVSQVVDVNKGLHCFTAKKTKIARKIEALPERETNTY